MRERRAAAVANARTATLRAETAETAEAEWHAAGAAAAEDSTAEAAAYEAAMASEAAAAAARQQLATVTAEAALAAQVFESLCGVALVKSDYAAQLETKRKFNTTCGRPERHNLLV